MTKKTYELTWEQVSTVLELLDFELEVSEEVAKDQGESDETRDLAAERAEELRELMKIFLS